MANLQRPELQKARTVSLVQVDGVQKPTAQSPSPDEDEDEDGDVDMDQSYNAVEDPEELAARAQRDSSAPEATKTDTGLEEEATLTRGIGSTLNLLTQRQILKKNDSEDQNDLDRNRQKFLAKKRQRELEAEKKARQQREQDRSSGHLNGMSAREREDYAHRENRHRGQLESRSMAEMYVSDYKPGFQIKYVDGHGREIGQKEAFKQLSHQFHGKGSGKQKTEKHLKRIEVERKKEAQSSLDSGQGTGMNSALGATAKKNKQAGVRLA